MHSLTAEYNTEGHGGIVDALREQARAIRQALCYYRQSKGATRFQYAQVAAISVLSGPGLHPVVGDVVTGSGLAGGLALNLEWVPTAPFLFTNSTEGRESVSGFWEIGDSLTITSTTVVTADNRALNGALVLEDANLRQLPYYGTR